MKKNSSVKQPKIDNKGELSSLRMPHERDESSDSQKSKLQPIIEQAYKDLEAGLQDTDLRNTPGYQPNIDKSVG